MNDCGGHRVAKHFCSLAQGKQAFWQQQERGLLWPRPVQAHFLDPKPTQVPFLPQTNLHPKPTQAPRIDILKHDLKLRIRPSLTSYPFDFYLSVLRTDAFGMVVRALKVNILTVTV